MCPYYQQCYDVYYECHEKHKTLNGEKNGDIQDLCSSCLLYEELMHKIEQKEKESTFPTLEQASLTIISEEKLL